MWYRQNKTSQESPYFYRQTSTAARCPAAGSSLVDMISICWITCLSLPMPAAPCPEQKGTHRSPRVPPPPPPDERNNKGAGGGRIFPYEQGGRSSNRAAKTRLGRAFGFFWTRPETANRRPGGLGWGVWARGGFFRPPRRPRPRKHVHDCLGLLNLSKRISRGPHVPSRNLRRPPRRPRPRHLPPAASPTAQRGTTKKEGRDPEEKAGPPRARPNGAPPRSEASYRGRAGGAAALVPMHSKRAGPAGPAGPGG